MQAEPVSGVDDPGEISRAATDWLALLERLATCYRRMRAELTECTRDHGLSDSEFLLLWLCGGTMPRGLDQSELSSRAAVSPANVSGRVERLRQLGYLEAFRDCADRRRQVWRVTPHGKTILARILVELEPRASVVTTDAIIAFVGGGQ